MTNQPTMTAARFHEMPHGRDLAKGKNLGPHDRGRAIPKVHTIVGWQGRMVRRRGYRLADKLTPNDPTLDRAEAIRQLVEMKGEGEIARRRNYQ
jgi:hypothetical protein